MSKFFSSNRVLLIVSIVLAVFLSLVQSFIFFEKFFLKANLVLVFLVFIQQYLDFFSFFLLSLVVGGFLDAFLLNFPVFSLKFFLWALLVSGLRRKVFFEDKFAALLTYFLLGEVLLGFSLPVKFWFSLPFLKELIFDTTLFIMVFLFRKLL